MSEVNNALKIIREDLISIQKRLDALIVNQWDVDNQIPKVPPVDMRPANCRDRLQEEGKPYPRSGCQVCNKSIFDLCPNRPKVI